MKTDHFADYLSFDRRDGWRIVKARADRSYLLLGPSPNDPKLEIAYTGGSLADMKRELIRRTARRS